MKKRKGKFVPGGFRLVVRKSRTGKGLFTEDPIPKGACIIEYKGRKVSKEEEYSSKSRYLFEVNARKTIDGKPPKNKAGYINHSCAGNSEPEVRTGRVFIMARKAVRPGEELTYDYGDEYFNDYLKPIGCKCGSSRCRSRR